MRDVQSSLQHPVFVKSVYGFSGVNGMSEIKPTACCKGWSRFIWLQCCSKSTSSSRVC